MTAVSAPDLSVVIVGYNSLPMLASCLESLRDTRSRATVETIVVDNASSDGTRELVRREFPAVRLIANGRNLGYSSAVNQGIAAARAPFALVLNPDVVVHEHALDRLADFMNAHPDAGIAGSKLLNGDGTIQHSCRRFYTFWTLVLRRTVLGRVFKNSRAISSYLMLDFDHERSREVDWVIGACMMVRKEALSDVGGMDERFFLYFEDVDWCYRIWKSGWKVYYVADSVMTHRYARESAKPGISRQLITHILSMLHFYEKWGRASYGLKKFRHVITTALLLVSDLLAINVGFGLAYLLRSSLRGLLEKPLFGISTYWSFLAFGNLVFVFSFAFFGMYAASVERERASDIALRMFRATVVAATILMASTYIASQTLYSRVLVLAFCGLAVVVSVIFRLVLRRLHRLLRAGRFDLTRVAIVGTGDHARRLAERLLARSGLGYDLAGLVASDGGQAPAGFAVIGNLDELPDLVETHRIGEVIFADPNVSDDAVANFLIKARRRAVDVKMVSGLTGILTQRARVEEFLDLPVVAFEKEALLRAGAGVKRTLDVLGAGLLLVVWAPFLAVATLVTLAARGRPPLARSPRAGRGGSTYDMLTLVPTEGPDPLRRFISGHGLAWFPAVWNVLTGDMSFVGPQPVAPVDAETLDLRERLRFDARPGITGLAQVSLAEGENSPPELRALDAYYVQNWSLGGDAKILMRWLLQCFLGWASQDPPAGPGEGDGQ